MEALKKVLIVDDEPDSIEYVQAVLSSIGEFHTIHAADGEEGLKKTNENLPDLVILDVMMPGLDGFKVFYELRKNKETKNIPIIMLTGIADKVGIRFFKDDMKKYFGYEPIDYIEKPLVPERLTDAVKKVFNL